jgi:hypothetical protein
MAKKKETKIISTEEFIQGIEEQVSEPIVFDLKTETLKEMVAFFDRLQGRASGSSNDADKLRYFHEILISPVLGWCNSCASVISPVYNRLKLMYIEYVKENRK